jgi:hypothetical protein
MFHAISACLHHQARRISTRQSKPRELAAEHGWQARRVGFATWEYRDPRFDTLTPDRPAPVRRRG